MKEIILFTFFVIPSVIGWTVLLNALKELIYKPLDPFARRLLMLIDGKDVAKKLKYEIFHNKASQMFVLLSEADSHNQEECIRLLEEYNIEYLVLEDLTERKG